jgi:hypothetical protein
VALPDLGLDWQFRLTAFAEHDGPMRDYLEKRFERFKVA